TLDELLEVSDFVTVHLPKTPETVGLIGHQAPPTGHPTPRPAPPGPHASRPVTTGPMAASRTAVSGPVVPGPAGSGPVASGPAHRPVPHLAEGPRFHGHGPTAHP
ncbi:hypothetical protein OK074_6104, partial [Actinobacteria bacterium OK074]